MARMIPAECPHDTASEAERALFIKLRDTLDDSYTVLHSFELLTARGRGHSKTEVDFVVISPLRGIIVLEVKGGILRYDGNERVWYQNDFPLDISPYKQAANCAYAIIDYLKDSLKLKQLPFPVGSAVAFPDVAESIETFPPEALPQLTLTRDHCKYPDLALASLYTHYSSIRSADPDLGARILALLTKSFEYGARFSDQVEKINDTIHRLTEEQCKTLEMLGEFTEARIEGCAGSGKTVMALKKARQLASEGKSVLFLCFNAILASRLRASTSGIDGEVVPTTFHQFCLDVTKTASGELPITNTPDFWDTELPQAAYDSLCRNPRQYDAVIVDEAQDFKEEYWVVVEKARKPQSTFYLFYDPEQNLYNEKSDLSIPVKTPPLKLFQNCRNTRAICGLLGRLRRTRFTPNAYAPPGLPVFKKSCRTQDEARKTLSGILTELTVKQGLATERIVILGAHSMRNTSIGNDSSVGSFTISENGTERGKAAVSYYTYMKFKGCESDAVILLDVDPNDSRWRSPRRMYTAISRARSLLYILYRQGAPN